MKTVIFIFIALVCASALASSTVRPPSRHLLGAKECTWGPSYWCQNLTAAGDCHAVKHCIQTVWIHKELPVDTSSVCQTCLDMVKQARDQLESNETQELIKEVFEGSCALIHIKPVVRECDKIADNYIPELIDTLASQMNPQVVCSVAGLCNNERIQRLAIGNEEDIPVTTPKTTKTCAKCNDAVKILRKRFDEASPNEIMQRFLRICGHVGSLSDACSNAVIKYFNIIYEHLQENFHPTDVCLLAGECNAHFHTHADIEITPMSDVGYVNVNGDDLPCDFCEQLVGHLRDLLVANTTEDEFQKVLEGLCKQTQSFKSECLSIVDEYYSVFYSFLLKELNSTYVCTLAGICPQKGLESGPFAPLLPVESAQKVLEITPPSPEVKLGRVNMAMEGSSVKVMQTPEQAQLPIERLVPPHIQIMYDTQLCTFCEYFLHYVQQAITNPSTESEIKKVVDEACDRLPSSINDTCIQFVDTYGDAFVAILAQEIDPSTVCPLIRACPSAEVKDVEIFMQQKGGNGNCPLCLFAVTKLEEMVKDKKTEANIRQALTQLCSHLTNNLISECEDFVDTYTDELVEMLIADLKPQEVCVYLKMCTDNTPAPPLPTISPRPQIHYGGEVETNEIPDDTYNGKLVRAVSPVAANPQCILCEFIMKEIDDQLKNKKNEDEIKQAVYDVCNIMPKTLRKECDDFVNQYADTIIQLLVGALEPSEICAVMNLCTAKNVALKVEILDCALCQVVVEAMYKVLGNRNVDHNLEHIVEKVCRILPEADQLKCKDMIESNGETIINLILHLKSRKEVCQELMMCSGNAATLRNKRQLGASTCSRGPGYWCESEANAKECGNSAVKYCQTKVWLAASPSS